MFNKQGNTQIIEYDAPQTQYTASAMLLHRVAITIAKGVRHLMSIQAAKLRGIAVQQQAIEPVREALRRSAHDRPPIASEPPITCFDWARRTICWRRCTSTRITRKPKFVRR